MLLLAGPLLVLLAIASYTALLFTGLLPRSLWVFPWPCHLAVALGVVLALILALRRRRRALPALAATLVLAGAFVVGLPIATRLPAAATSPTAIGAAPPGFSLPSTDGGDVTLSDLAGREVVLVFHRGHW